MAVQNLFLGFGGTGTHILTHLKEFAHYKYGEKPDYLEFKQFDTIATENWKPGETINVAGAAGQEETIFKGKEVSLDPTTEYFFLGDSGNSLSDLTSGPLRDVDRRKRDFPHLDDWLNSDWLSRILPGAALNISRGAAQQRQIGRFAMFTNVQAVINDISKKLREMKSRAGGDTVNVWVVGSAAGGTGAGCLIDAGYIARLAAKQSNQAVVLTAVLVLPEVYSELDGIDKGRAYAMIREIERVQEVGLEGAPDLYSAGGARVTSDVIYDREERLHSTPPNKLFDYLIYLSDSCANEKQRIRFFGAAASALDPYVDRNVGATMMEKLVNTTGVPIGIGASRLTLPKNTYADRFVWTEVQSILEAILPPKIDPITQRPIELLSGSTPDREAEAEGRIRELAALFDDILEFARVRGDDAFEDFVKNQLSPKQIIEKWYQFAGMSPDEAGVSQDDLELLPLLAYCNPLKSRTMKPDVEVPTSDLEVRTLVESKKLKNKISAKDSAIQFSDELIAIRTEYLDSSEGSNNFERGRRFVFDTMSRRLKNKIDESLKKSLANLETIRADKAALDNGTSFTRLRREVEIMASPEGPLAEVEARVRKMVDLSRKTSNDRQLDQTANDAVAELRDTKPGGMLGGGDRKVNAAQKEARDAMWNFIGSQQKERLLEDLLKLLNVVRQRFGRWLKAMDAVKSNLTVSEDDSKAGRACWDQIKKRLQDLEDRLYRMSEDDSQLITLDANNPADKTMQGYETKLRSVAMRSNDDGDVGDEFASKARWNVSFDDQSDPSISLAFGDNVPLSHRLSEVHRDLYKAMRKQVDVRLQEITIFDFLQFIDNEYNLSAGDVTNALLGKSKSLLKTEDGVQNYQWVHARPRGEKMSSYATELQNQLKAKKGDNVKDSQSQHSDPDSITLLSVSSPKAGTANDLPELQSCATAYLSSVSTTAEGAQNRRETENSLIYHIFRGEQEAWFIERQAALHDGHHFDSVKQLTPPRISRLLSSPGLTKGFVQCVATGAIHFDKSEMVWKMAKSNEEEVTLTRPNEDLIRAMVVVCLQRRSDIGRQIRLFSENELNETASAAAIRSGSNLVTKMREYHEDTPTIEAFIEQRYQPAAGDLNSVKGEERQEHIRNALLRVFKFYSSVNSHTDLARRSV